MKNKKEVEKYINELDRSFGSKTLRKKMQDSSFGEKGYRYEQDKDNPSVFYKVYRDKNKTPERHIFNENDELVKDEE